ncbi:hypothetical protein ACLK1T_20785 [Escherichia coli]
MKARIVIISVLSTLVVHPGDESFTAATPKRAVGVLHLPLGDENRAPESGAGNTSKNASQSTI